MRRTLLFLFALLGFLPLTAQSTEQLTSPDGKYVFTFSSSDGHPTYTLLYMGKKIVSNGDLGINIDNHLIENAMGIPQDTARIWSSSMRLIKVDRSTADTTWQPLYGEQSLIRDHYNAMTLHFKEWIVKSIDFAHDFGIEEVISGPVEKIDDTTFRIIPYDAGWDNQRRSFSVLLVAVGEPDKQYRGCVQPVMLKLPHDIIDKLQ